MKCQFGQTEGDLHRCPSRCGCEEPREPQWLDYVGLGFVVLGGLAGFYGLVHLIYYVVSK